MCYFNESARVCVTNFLFKADNIPTDGAKLRKLAKMRLCKNNQLVTRCVTFIQRIILFVKTSDCVHPSW